MNNTDLCLYGMTWLTENAGPLTLLAFALIPLGAFALVAYALHVVKRALGRGERP